MFYSSVKLTSLNLSNFIISSDTVLSSMFRNCSSLEYLDISNFNNFYSDGKMFMEVNNIKYIDLGNVDNTDYIQKEIQNTKF